MPCTARTKPRDRRRSAKAVPAILPAFLVLMLLLDVLPIISGADLQAPAARASSPMTWEKYGGNPVVGQGPAGDWDSVCIAGPNVIREGNNYSMWYGGGDQPVRLFHIGRATSNDGLSWTKDPTWVLGPGSPGTWEGVGVSSPMVIKEGATYKMWYTGYDGYIGICATHCKVGYATSTDGRLWTKYPGNPVMDYGLPGSWEDWGVIAFTVLHENGLYKMWYGGMTEVRAQMGYATSPDGLTWTKYTKNPVLAVGSAGQWDELHLSHLSVVNASGTYRAWYGGDNGFNWNIGNALSSDGVNWTKYPGNPVMTFEGTGWEDHDNFEPYVMYDDDTYRMWYTGVTDYTDPAPWIYSIGYAETKRPPPPSAISPVDDALANVSRPSFSWAFRDLNGNSTSAGFRLQLATDGGFTKIRYDSGRVGSGASTLVPGIDLTDGSYFWRVMAWDLNGVGSRWSTARTLQLDTTPPANPAGLYSTTHSVASWSGRTGISVRWTIPANGDPGSGYEGFSIVWDESGSTVPDETIELSGNSTTSHPMSESDRIFFHVRARDRAGNWNHSAVHLGPFRVDPTSPENPSELQSTDHSTRGWSNDSEIQMAWSGADGGPSGLGGYSAIWDEWPFSLPWPNPGIDGDADSNISPPLADGDSWYFHLRTMDAAGNWEQGAVHSGPYWIDTVPPSTATGLISDSHSTRTWSNLRGVNISWGAADDALSGLGGYAHVWDTSPETVPPERVDLAGGVLAVFSPALSDGSGWYFHLRAVDAAGNWESGAAHSGPYWIDSTPPGGPGNLTSTSHTVGQQSQSNIVNISWSAADGGPSGLWGYSCTWDNSADTLPPEKPNASGEAVAASSPPLADGDQWYFHIRACDGAGNWALEAAHMGPFSINTTPPEPANDPPVITDMHGPDNGSKVSFGQLGFSVEAYDPEGKALTYRWYENGQIMGNERNLSIRFLPGDHKLVVRVSDGLHATLGRFNFTVLPPDSGKPAASGPVVAVPPEAVVGGAVAIWAAGALSILAGVEVIKYHFILLFLPLFTRLHKEEVLNNELRGMIRGAIGADPGIHYNELVRQIDVANGTVAYHLMTLEREGIIKSRRDGVLKRFYPGDMKLVEIPVRLTGLQLLILRTVQRHEGLNQRNVAQELDLPYLAVHRQINKMVGLGVLRLDKRGISTRCFVADPWQNYQTEMRTTPLAELAEQ